MSKTWRLLLLIAGTFVFAVVALVLASSQDHSSMPGMDHSKMNMPEDSDQADAQEMGHTMQSMSMKHMDMGPHMKMTEHDFSRADSRTSTFVIPSESRDLGFVDQTKIPRPPSLAKLARWARNDNTNVPIGTTEVVP